MCFLYILAPPVLRASIYRLMNNKIRHTGCCIAMILCLIATSFVSSGCNKDGNETISLEFGNIRTMIIGRWYTSGGVYWDFYDSYYTRSDMGDRHLRWYIDDSYNGDRPYYGYIYLDNPPYGIVSMGGDSWTVGDSQGGTIDFTRDGNGTATENSGNGGSSSSSGSSNLVKRIEKRLNNSIVVSVDFEYDSRQLVSKATYTGKFGEVEAGIISGGFLKKKKVNFDSLDPTLFERIDIRSTTQLTIQARKVKVLSGVSSDSYTIARDGDVCVLTITDVERFWSTTRYLILQLS